MKIVRKLILIIGLGTIFILSGCSVESTDEAYFKFDKEKGAITEYMEEAPKDVVIPSEIDGVRVKSIGAAAFHRLDLESVIIPDSVVEIGMKSFGGNKLTDIKIPDSVVKIGTQAFIDSGLESVTLPKNLLHIPSGVFMFNKLKSISIPDGVESIDGGAFEKNNLTNLEIPKSVRIIKATAFIGNQLENVSIPDMVLVYGSLDTNTKSIGYEEYKRIAEEKDLVFISSASFDVKDSQDSKQVQSDLNKLGINQYTK